VSPQRVSALRTFAEAATAWVKDEGARAGEVANENVTALLRELGFLSRSDYDDLSLRVAQLEHRIRLLEAERDGGIAATPDPAQVHASARVPPAS